VAALPGYTLVRTLDWKDPVDLIGQGIFIPEATAPSAAVKFVKGAGLQGAVGEVLRQGSGMNASEITIGVVKLESAAAATKLRDWMHGQDLQQPCFSECIFTPHNVPVPGIPTGRLVVQSSPAPPPPPGLPKNVRLPEAGGPTNYRAEFTTGPYLYFAETQGGPKDQARFVAGAQGYYNAVKAKS
jgi:hypothetical protein